VEPVEYMTLGWGDEADVADMLGQLNELGAQGWKVCAAVSSRVSDPVVGLVSPSGHHGQFLLLKRHKAA
jgi:hypothetical protein